METKFSLFQPPEEQAMQPRSADRPVEHLFHLFQQSEPPLASPATQPPVGQFQQFPKPTPPAPPPPLPVQKEESQRPEPPAEPFQQFRKTQKSSPPLEQIPQPKASVAVVEPPRQPPPAIPPRPERKEAEIPHPYENEASPKPSGGVADWIANNMKPLLIAAGVMIGLTLLYTVVDSFRSSNHPVKQPDTKGETILSHPPPPEKHKPDSPQPPANSPAAPVTSTGYVQTKEGSGLWLHSLPSKESTQTGSIPNHSTVEILGYGENFVKLDGETGKWCRVKYGGKTGWVWGNFVVNK